ncbi:MAG: formylglycine-generating enzyme family protein [Nitrosomonadales bacterium]
MIQIPAGAFKMGTDYERADPQDRPMHTVKLPVYWMDKYLVTNAQYARFVVATSHRPPLNWKDGKIPKGESMRPVTMITWYDAKTYATWAVNACLPRRNGEGRAGHGWATVAMGKQDGTRAAEHILQYGLGNQR